MKAFAHIAAVISLPIFIGAAGCDAQLHVDPFPVAGHKCGLRSDQARSFLPPVKSFPIRVVFDRGFDRDDRAKLNVAIDRWNAFGEKSLGVKFFEAEAPEAAIDMSAMPFATHYCKASVKREKGLVLVKVTSERRWRGGEDKEKAGAVTIRCTTGGDGAAPEMSVAFNVSQGREDALLAEALHELGHVLGLGHSCANEEKRVSKNYRACSDLGDEDPYRIAIMYPELEVHGTYGRVSPDREILHANDMERVYCLYSRLVSPK
ncbi:MAG: hypothetical protein HY075_01450 [Deltaproteobacteria bacterium]|nr:hypothetical protein [Deltaproteobacteria bacterium]